MKFEYVTNTKDKVIVSYSIYAILFELGLSPSNKGTIYLKELIEYVIINNLTDLLYKEILEGFIKAHSYQEKNVKLNIRNCIRSIDYQKAEKNFSKILGIEFDSYYLVPKQLIILLSLKLKY